MPCLSYEPSVRHEPSYDSEKAQLKKDKANLEAALCTAMTFIEKSLSIDVYVNTTDWEEAGITPAQVQSWWEGHKEKDRIRRDKEAKAKAAEEKRKREHEEKVAKLQAKTWSELTKAEIKFLTTHTKK